MSRKKLLTPALLSALILLAGRECGAASDDILQALKPVTDATLGRAAADDWLMRRGSFAGWGYSTLDQVNVRNVNRAARLGLEHGAGLSGGGAACARWRIIPSQPQERCAGAGRPHRRFVWEYRRELPKIEGGYHNDLLDRARGTIACTIQSAAGYGGRTYGGAQPAHWQAIWDTAVADYRQGTRSPPGRWPLRRRSSPAFPAALCGHHKQLFHRRTRPKTGVEVSRTRTIAQPGEPGMTAGTASRQTTQRRLGWNLGSYRCCP